MVTQNQLPLQILLENQPQWNAKQRLEREKLAAKWRRMAAKWDQWPAEVAKPAE
jgi:hypothetical protein